MLDTSAKMATRTAKKLYQFQKREIVNEIRDKKLFLRINFLKKIKSSMKIKQEKHIKNLNG